MPISTMQFVEQLSASGLMSDDEIRTFQDNLPAEDRPRDGKEFARELQKYRKLTKFQLRAVYYGKTEGLLLGNYIVRDKYEKDGPYGPIYRGSHRGEDDDVDLYVLKKLPGRDFHKTFGRLQRDIRRMNRLKSPHILPAIEAEQAGVVYFVARRHVPGRTLLEQVKSDGPLPVSRALDCVMQAARGLEHAHAHSYVHRNMQPSKLLLDDTNTVWILDLEMYRVEGGDDTPMDGSACRTSLPDDMLETVMYSAPEQLDVSHPMTPSCDIYSLGCTLFFLLIGAPPYPAKTVANAMLAQLQSPIPSLRQQRRDVLPAVDAVFQRMVAKEIPDRYATMSDTLAALKAVAVRS